MLQWLRCTPHPRRSCRAVAQAPIPTPPAPPPRTDKGCERTRLPPGAIRATAQERLSLCGLCCCRPERTPQEQNVTAW